MSTAKLTSRVRAQAQTREALLEAARRLVAQHGFGGTSIGDIVAEAGFTKGAFYSNFESREAMLLELLVRIQAEQDEALDMLEESAPKDVSHAIEHLAELAVRHAASQITPLLVAEFQLQARRDSSFRDEAQAGFDRRITAIAAWIDRLKQTHRAKTRISSVYLARTVLGLSQAYALQPIDHSEIRPMVTKVLESLFD